MHLPIKVSLALTFVEIIQSRMMLVKINPKNQDLSPEEKRAYNAALEILTLYLNGEETFSDKKITSE